MDFDLIRSGRKTLAAEIRNGRLLIRAPRYASRDEITRFIMQNRRWIETHLERAAEAEKKKEGIRKLTRTEIRELAEKALQVLPERAAFFAPKIGVSYSRITIRMQRTRWGSCSSKGNLNFNCLLMLTPPEVQDSVVVHELCHLKHMNHSPRFYEEILKVMPDYRTHQKWLKENGSTILAMVDTQAPE